MINKKDEGYITSHEHEQLNPKPTISKVFVDRDSCIECGCLDPDSNSAACSCSDCRYCWVLCE